MLYLEVYHTIDNDNSIIKDYTWQRTSEEINIYVVGKSEIHDPCLCSK
jgi:hypothetical protein